MKRVFAFLLLAPLCAWGQPPLSRQEVENAGADVLDLGSLEVVGQGFSFEQELQLRLVRQALKSPRSEKPGDIDAWVCWYDRPTGTRRKHLYCGRNGDLWALRPSTNGPPGSGSGLTQLVNGTVKYATKGYGTLWVSRFGVYQKRFEETLARLPGSDDFDREFIALASLGRRPPRDIPDADELDQFAAAYQELETLAASGAGEADQLAAIEAEGLTLLRYNQIVELISTYQSLMNEVALRTGQLQQP